MKLQKHKKTILLQALALLLFFPVSFSGFFPVTVASQYYTEWVQQTKALDKEKTASFFKNVQTASGEKGYFPQVACITLQVIHTGITQHKLDWLHSLFSDNKSTLQQRLFQVAVISASEVPHFSEPV